jgi:hypothetical protein
VAGLVGRSALVISSIYVLTDRNTRRSDAILRASIHVGRCIAPLYTPDEPRILRCQSDSGSSKPR